MKRSFLVAVILILTVLLGCDLKPPAQLPYTEKSQAPRAQSDISVLPLTEPPMPTSSRTPISPPIPPPPTPALTPTPPPEDAQPPVLSEQTKQSTGTEVLVIRPTGIAISSTTLPATTIIPGTTPTIDKGTFQAIDQYALGTPNSAAKSVDSLATYLIKPAKNDFERAWAIYRWITQNISYDFSAYLTKNYGTTQAKDVLVSRRSVCEGYSDLFNALAKSAGLEVTTIPGWAKGYGYNAGDQITGPTNHAWNAMKINGVWYLVDSTWGAGSIIQQRFVRKFDDGYFLTPPEQFIYNHFPEDTRWQLLSSPVTQTDFASWPYVYGQFFRYGLNLGSNTQGVIKTYRDLSITLPVPNDVVLTAELFQGNGKMARTYALAQRQGNQYQISAVFPSAGSYVLHMYAKKKSDTGDYDAVLEYRVEVSEASLNPSGFPKTYEAFSINGVYLYSPLTGQLRAGTAQDFKLTVPGAEDVQIVTGNDWHPLARQGEQFSGSVPVNQGRIEVCAKFPGNAQYSVLLDYTGSP